MSVGKTSKKTKSKAKKKTPSTAYGAASPKRGSLMKIAINSVYGLVGGVGGFLPPAYGIGSLPPSSGGGRTIGIVMKTGNSMVEVSNGNMKIIGSVESRGKEPLFDAGILHGIKAGLAVINMDVEEGQALCERIRKSGSDRLSWADDILMFNNSGDTED